MKAQNYFLSLLTMALIGLLSMTFVACGDDDDEDEVTEKSSKKSSSDDDDDVNANSIIGTWTAKYGPDTITLIFKANGKGSWTERGDDATGSGSFVYQMTSNNEGFLIYSDDEEDSEKTYATFHLYGSKLSVVTEDDDHLIFTKH